MKLHAWTCGGHQQLAYGGGWWERHLWARDDGWRLAELGTVEQVGEGGTSLEGKRVGEKGVRISFGLVILFGGDSEKTS